MLVQSTIDLSEVWGGLNRDEKETFLISCVRGDFSIENIVDLCSRTYVEELDYIKSRLRDIEPEYLADELRNHGYMVTI